MKKPVRVSETFHEFLKVHKREEETMEETLRRLIGGTNPADVSGIISSKTAAKMWERLETKREPGVDEKNELRQRFE